MESEKGCIYKIQPLSIHFGPGIRTAVFLQGCPLQCRWCPFPEVRQAITFIEKNCTVCGICRDACPAHAIEETEEGAVRINQDLCNGCGICVEQCPAGALEQRGTCYSVEGLLREVEKGIPAYRHSGGGVTVGGGEPALQAEFVATFLQQCRRHSIHSAVETRAFGPWHKIATIAEWPDLFYITLSCIDDKAHREATGVSNQSILHNIRKVAAERPVILRVPIFPHTSGLDETIRDIASFTKSLGTNVHSIELFFRPEAAAENGCGLAQSAHDGQKTPYYEEDTASALKDLLESHGVHVRIDGWKGG